MLRIAQVLLILFQGFPAPLSSSPAVRMRTVSSACLENALSLRPGVVFQNMGARQTPAVAVIHELFGFTGRPGERLMNVADFATLGQTSPAESNQPFSALRSETQIKLQRWLGLNFRIDVTGEIRNENLLPRSLFDGWESFIQAVQLGPDVLSRVILTAWELEQPWTWVDGKRVSAGNTYGAYDRATGRILLNVAAYSVKMVAFHELSEALFSRFADQFPMMIEDQKERLVDVLTLRILSLFSRELANQYQGEMDRHGSDLTLAQNDEIHQVVSNILNRSA